MVALAALDAGVIRWACELGAVIAVVALLVSTPDAWLFGRDQEGIAWDQQVEFSVQHSLILNAFRLVGRGYIQPQSVTQLSYYHFPYFTDQLLPALLLTLVVVAGLQLYRTASTTGASATRPYLGIGAGGL